MKVLVIGATGFVGSGVCRALRDSGHEVYGFSRSPDADKKLNADGFNAVRGELTDHVGLQAMAEHFDAVVFGPMIPYEEEEPIVEVLLDACRRTGRTMIFISGTGVLAIPALAGDWDERNFAEHDAFTPPPWLEVRVQTEQLVRRHAAEGVRAMIIRPPLVWGHGGSKQIPAIFDSVASTGQACYLENGLNLYSNVHVDDLGRVFSLALEKGTAGAVYHAVAGEANFRQIAEAVAEVMGTTARSVTYKEACDIWGEFIVQFGFAVNSRSRSPRTRSELGWQPLHLDVIADIREGSYRTAYGSPQ